MARRGAVAEWLGRGLQSLVQRFESARRLSQAQVSALPAVCLNVVNPLREQLEYAVREAAQKERTAWAELERAGRRDDADETVLRTHRERWQAAAHALVRSLQALKR